MANRPTILLVDDEVEVLKALTRTLRSLCEVKTAESGSDALEILKNETIHLIIADQQMPVMSGVELLKIVYEKYPHIVRVILTGFSDVNDLIDAINDARIYRYLTKPWENKELKFVVQRAIERFQLQEENQSLIESVKNKNKKLRQKEKELVKSNRVLEKTVMDRTREIRRVNTKLQKIAVTDPLTKLPNRRHFKQRLDEELSRFERFGRPISLLMIDVDYFKQYNDLGGHPNGDKALRKIAKILIDNSRVVDTVARYGGEEFVLLLPETDKKGAEVIGERLRKGVEEESFPFERKLPQKNLTVSIGLATVPTHCKAAQIIKKADAALYQAKKRGRNQLIVPKSQ